MMDLEKIKKLREETGFSISEIKKALQDSNGDLEKAKEALRKWGKDIASKKTERETKAGLIDGYVHLNGTTGVLLELRCESDFVAKSPEFKNLAHEICLQIAAMNPLFIKEEDIPEEILQKEKEIYLEQFKDTNKPQHIIEQIIEGKLKKYKQEISLLSQPWIKDEKKMIKNLIEETISKVGENIEIKKFVRYEL